MSATPFCLDSPLTTISHRQKRDIPESLQSEWLAAIAADPHAYSRIMHKVVNYDGVTRSEVALFEKQDPHYDPNGKHYSDGCVGGSN